MKVRAQVLTFVCMLMLSFVATASPVPLTYGGYSAGINDGFHYVGKASGALDGDPITMWCVDSLHTISGNTWMVNVVQLDDPALEGVLGLTRNDFKAMFLLGQRFNNTSADVKPQHAIWSFADSAHYPLTPGESAMKAWAQSAVGQYSFAGAYALVGVPTRSASYTGQNMLTGVASPVPEPASVLIFGGGLVALVLWRKHRRA